MVPKNRGRAVPPKTRFRLDKMACRNFGSKLMAISSRRDAPAKKSDRARACFQRSIRDYTAPANHIVLFLFQNSILDHHWAFVLIGQCYERDTFAYAAIMLFHGCES